MFARTFLPALLGLLSTEAALAQATSVAATAAPLNRPQAVAVDTAGNAYVANAENPERNGSLVKIAPNGTATMLYAATGSVSSVTIDAGGTVYFTAGSAGIFRIPPGGTPGLFIAYPDQGGTSALATDAGSNVYAAGSSGAIYRVTPAGAVSTFATVSTQGGSVFPGAMTFDTNGNLYIQNNSIVEITPSGTVLSPPGSFEYPGGIAPGPNGTLYVATVATIFNDMGEIDAYDPSTGAITKIFSARALSPSGLTTDAQGNILLVDNEANRLSRLTPGGAISLITDGHFGSPTAMVYDKRGNLYVANAAAYTITKVTPDGTASTFVDAGAGLVTPSALALDPAGNLYVSNQQIGTISKVTPAGTVSSFVSQGIGYAEGLAVDKAGTLYVADSYAGAVYKVSPTGDLSLFVGRNQGLNGAESLAFDAAGNLYVAGANETINRVTPQGQISAFASLEQDGYEPSIMVFDQAGTLYVADILNGVLAITPDGGESVLTRQIADALSLDSSGRLLMANDWTNTIYRVAVTPSPIAASVLPGSRSVEIGKTATIFATMVNSADTDLTSCSIDLPPYIADLNLNFQTTDPATNVPTGSQNAAVTIPAHTAQSFVLSFESNSALTMTDGLPVFLCDGVAAAAPVPGVNTVDFTASESQVADVVVLAATTSNDGTVHLANGNGAFAVATINVGSSNTLTVSADTGAATLPVSIVLCQTSNGQCLTPAAASVPVSFAAGADSTFSVFVGANASIPFAPGTARVFVRFKDASGGIHGSTSVAVTTR